MCNVTPPPTGGKPEKPIFLSDLFVDFVEEAAEQLARAIEAGHSAHASLERLVRLSQPSPRYWGAR